MSVSVIDALAHCARTRTWAVGMCDNFCGNMYGFGNSGYVDATAHWNALTAAQRHPGDSSAPAGMLVFWGGGHGHVAISDGTGSIWSTDISGAGTVSRVPLSRVAAVWGKPYLGWSKPVFQGVDWSGAMPRVMRDSTNPADIPVAGTDLVAGYSNGSYAWSAAGWARFPNAGHVTIDVNGSNPSADVLDVEPGDATVGGGVVWLRKALAVTRDYVPVIYCNRSNRTAFVTAAKAAGFSANTHYKFWVATLDGTRTLADMNGVAAIQWGGTGQTGGHYDQSDVFDDTWKATDMPLNAADKTWISGEIAKQLKDPIAKIVSLYNNLMTIKGLDDGVDHAAGYYVAHLASDVSHARTDLAAVKSQASTNGTSLTQANTALASLQAALAAVDLSQLPAEIAAKVTAMKLNVTVTEGP